MSGEAAARRSIDARVAELLACPRCGGPVRVAADVRCEQCASRYPVTRGVPDLRPALDEVSGEVEDWTGHWSGDNQSSASQRFFSLYRRHVFARTVAHFIDRHFPPRGVFVEAGCGTSETSMRIDKRQGQRVLVAIDVVPAVVERAHDVMDVRLCADAFRLPFRGASVDGIWNVGVMEHFTHDRIDVMLREFRRVLKPGAPIALLWPATTSPPQRILRALEAVIHLRSGRREFRFHPPEISQLRSDAEGREVLRRNGFSLERVDSGWRSLFAFKTLVGRG